MQMVASSSFGTTRGVSCACGIAAPPKFIDAIDGVATPPSKGEQVLRPEVAAEACRRRERLFEEIEHETDPTGHPTTPA